MAEGIQDRLDDLLLSYLDVVDTYTRLQDDISQNFVSGYLSIAQANYASPTTRRYGQDFYDERMKAMKGVSISFAKYPVFKSRQFPLDEVTEGDLSGVRRRKGGKEAHNGTAESDGKEEEKQSVKRDPRDPIKWFGILAPLALKDAQLKFSNVLDQLPELVTLLRNLDWHEQEIRKLRMQVNHDEIDA